MKERQLLRDSVMAKDAADKSCNRLIALPGSPGIGKSTFMAHFSESQEYKNYTAYRSSQSPIVAPLTFNSAMNSGESLFGLRILFGAVKCMVTSTAPRSNTTWADFWELFSRFDSLSAVQAILILRRTYGPTRLVLLLVDEVSKAKFTSEIAGKDVMTQIGSVLDSDGNTDVVLSSLSPKYVETLLSGSNRLINYCVLLPILDVNIVGDICKQWSTRMVRKYVKHNKNDEFIPRVLESMPLLASGHPRSIEWMNKTTKILDDDAKWKSTIKALKSGSNAALLIQNLIKDLNALKDFGEYGKLENIDLCFNAALSWNAFFPSNDTIARNVSEENGMFLIPNNLLDTNTAFRFGMRLGAFVQYLSYVAVETKSPVVQAAAALFGDVFAENSSHNISVWWERAVALTIVSRTMSGQLDIFGSTDGSLASMKGGICPMLTVRLNDTETSLRTIRNGELAITPPNFQGSDGIVSLMGYMIYLQMKIARPKGKDMSRVFFEAVLSILQSHTLLFPNIPLSKVSVIFYEWSYINETEKQKLAKDILRMFRKWIDKKGYDDTKKQFSRKNPLLSDEILCEKARDCLTEITKFVNDGCCFTNVHYIDRGILKTWLLETLAPIPRLVQAIEEGD